MTYNAILLKCIVEDLASGNFGSVVRKSSQMRSLRIASQPVVACGVFAS